MIINLLNRVWRNTDNFCFCTPSILRAFSEYKLPSYTYLKCDYINQLLDVIQLNIFYNWFQIPIKYD